MQPARLDLSVIQGATYRLVLRIMQPLFEYRPITAIAATAPVRLTVDHGLPTDWPVWVRGVQRMQGMNREPNRERPHLAIRIDAATLEINPLSATGLQPIGGELVYNLPVNLTGATALVRVLDASGAELLSVAPTVHAGGWIELLLTDEQTAALAWREGAWLLDIELPTGEVVRAFTGTARVWPVGATPQALGGQCESGWVVSAGGQGLPGAPGPMGPAFQVDATGPTADRALYDDEEEGFAFLDTTTGLLYFRQGAGWSDGVQFQGPAGLSAYQVAVAEGFVGTELEWLAFLQGADGADGVGIASLVINGAGHLVVTYTNTVVADLGKVVGAAGTDGRGIASVAIDGGSHLIITYTDGTTEDAGIIPGAGGSATWGAIGGTLADQVDLAEALAGKASSAQGALADTAVQPAALSVLLDLKVDKIAGYGLSQENFTPAEKAKLAGLDGPLWKGTYTSLAALQSAHPTAEPGSSAHVDAGLGDPVKVYNWDASDGEWVAGGGDAAPVTAAQVKILYESNPDTNAFTNAEKSKLGGVAAGATANANTDSLPESATPTNKWFTDARVRGALATGLSFSDSTVIAATDSFLQIAGKLAARLALAFNRANHSGSQEISTVTGLDAALAARSLIAGLPSRTVTASGAVTPADAGKWLICDSATPITLTIGAEATAAWTTSGILPMFHVLQIGAGAVTVTGDGFSVTKHADDTNVLAGAGAAATALWRASNTWSLFGRLVAA